MPVCEQTALTDALSVLIPAIVLWKITGSLWAGRRIRPLEPAIFDKLLRRLFQYAQ